MCALLDLHVCHRNITAGRITMVLKVPVITIFNTIEYVDHHVYYHLMVP